MFSYFQYEDFLKKNQLELLQLGKFLNIKYALKKKYPIVVHYRKIDKGYSRSRRLEMSTYYNMIKKMLKS